MYKIHTPEAVVEIETEAEFIDYSKDKIMIEAAGGLVINEIDEVLMIFRRGYWDLPKGKIDPGETIAKCAIREVQEETGLEDLKLIMKLNITYHTYKIDNEIYIKPTHWFKMLHKKNVKLVPQTEEDITKIAWMDKKQVELIISDTYSSIREVLEQHYLDQNHLC